MKDFRLALVYLLFIKNHLYGSRYIQVKNEKSINQSSHTVQMVAIKMTLLLC